VLIGVVAGGAGLVLEAASAFAPSAQGPSISVGAALIRQGAYLAVERLAVYDTGSTPVSGFTVSTLGVSSSSLYCFTLTVPPGTAVVATDCPPTNPGPGSVQISHTVLPGGDLLVELTITGQAFVMGSSADIIVTTQDGAQSWVGLQVIGA
jgi:hypothetical protein